MALDQLLYHRDKLVSLQFLVMYREYYVNPNYRYSASQRMAMSAGLGLLVVGIEILIVCQVNNKAIELHS